ncbi:MAG: RNA polymerase sigma factor [Pseudomonadota bacterium]
MYLWSQLRVSKHLKIIYNQDMDGFNSRTWITSALSAHRADLKGFVRARVPPADVDDVLQVAAMRAVEKADTLREPTRVLPWLYRLHANVVIDAGRKRAREQRLMEAMANDAELVAVDTTSACACSIAQARNLSPNYAAILDLVDIGGVPLAKAAQVLNISVNNATVRLHRARAALKKRLWAHCGVTSPGACADCRCSYEGCCSA